METIIVQTLSTMLPIETVTPNFTLLDTIDHQKKSLKALVSIAKHLPKPIKRQEVLLEHEQKPSMGCNIKWKQEA